MSSYATSPIVPTRGGGEYGSWSSGTGSGEGVAFTAGTAYSDTGKSAKSDSGGYVSIPRNAGIDCGIVNTYNMLGVARFPAFLLALGMLIIVLIVISDSLKFAMETYRKYILLGTAGLSLIWLLLLIIRSRANYNQLEEQAMTKLNLTKDSAKGQAKNIRDEITRACLHTDYTRVSFVIQLLGAISGLGFSVIGLLIDDFDLFKPLLPARPAFEVEKQ